MFHQTFKKQDSKLQLLAHRFLGLINEEKQKARAFWHRFTSLEEADSVEGQSRSFRIWMFSSFGALVCILLLNFHATSSTDAPTAHREDATALTSDLLSQLPAGHVLVPIEPMNIDAIDAVFGQHGWADLFVERDDVDTTFRASGKPARRRIAVGIPLLRAPRNPSRLAVIVPETETRLVSELGQPVHVALRKSPAKKSGPEKLSRGHSFARSGKPTVQFELVHESGIEDAN